MSYDLWVESPEDKVVLKELLKVKMLSEGWEIRFLPDGSFLGEGRLILLPSIGPLNESILLAGWPAGQANSEFLAQLFTQGDVKQLDKLFMDEDAFCTCGLSVTKPNGQEQPNIKTEYYLRLSGSSIVDSWELTHAVWEAIGTLSNGELVNPQE